MNWKKILPHIAAVVVLIIVSLIYFSPVLNNKQLPQSDMMQFPCMNKALEDYTRATGDKSEWTPNMFSGMPSYQIDYGQKGNVFKSLISPLNLFDSTHSLGVFFLLALGFYVFMVCMGASPWLSLFAGLIYALASYNIIIINVGHITKAWAMAMMAPVLAGMILVFRKKYAAGFIVFTVSLALQLTFNHVQITYYTVITAFILGISYLVIAAKHKDWKDFGKSVAVLVLGAVLSVLPLSGHLLVNNEYVKHTMRGGSELTVHPQNDKQNINQNGLDINYAFNWSYGKAETMTLLIPDYMGGGSADTRISDESSKQLQNRIREIRNTAPVQQNQQRAQQLYNQYLGSTYYGEQPFTAGPVYFGSIVVFLALLGFLVLDNKWRWWLLAATVISILLSWGNNFMALNAWLFYHLPMYNKFRTPSMALVIANVTMCIAALMGLKYYLESTDEKKKKRSLFISMAVAGGITLLAAIIPSLFSDFTCSKDSIFAQELGQSFISALQQDRESMFTSDALRSFIFIAVAFAALMLYDRKIIKKDIIIICIIGLAAVIDLWGVDLRYVNKDSFRSRSELMTVATAAENQIMETTDANHINHYRVYNLTRSPFNDASTSYFMPSIGGYSAAKLQRYQDLIDFYFTNTQYKQKDLQDTALLKQNPMRQLYYQYRNAQGFPMPNFGVLNMLDTRYIIFSDNGFIENTEALGAAWFVKDIQWVNNADEEIQALDNFNPKQTAVIDKKYKDIVKAVNNSDTSAKIELTEDESTNITHLKYKTSSTTDNIAIFSEIFYKDSWHCYIDGKEVPYFCTDYVLRGVYVPKGNHTVEFVCSSDTLKKGNTVAFIGSAAVILCIIAIAAYPYYRKRKGNNKAKN